MNIDTQVISDVVCFDISGRFTRIDAREPTLHHLVKDQLESGKRKILVNFENTDFIDSFGFGEIVASYRSIQSLGGDFKLAGIHKDLHVVFVITGLDKILDIHNNSESALNSFKET